MRERNRQGESSRCASISTADLRSLRSPGIFGGADQGIPAAAVETFRAVLERAAVEHEITTYPDAPRSFFDRKVDEFAAASAGAWAQVRSFIDANSYL